MSDPFDMGVVMWSIYKNIAYSSLKKEFNFGFTSGETLSEIFYRKQTEKVIHCNQVCSNLPVITVSMSGSRDALFGLYSPILVCPWLQKQCFVL